MRRMRYWAGAVAVGAVMGAGGCSSMGPMDHSSMAKGGGCCGTCAMMAEKTQAMGAMSMPPKSQSGGLLPPI